MALRRSNSGQDFAMSPEFRRQLAAAEDLSIVQDHFKNFLRPVSGPDGELILEAIPVFTDAKELRKLGIAEEDIKKFGRYHPLVFNALADEAVHLGRGDNPVVSLRYQDRKVTPDVEEALVNLNLDNTPAILNLGTGGGGGNRATDVH